MPAPYRTLEHPSDIGLEMHGASPAEVFANAALGLMHVIGVGGAVEACEERTLDLEGADLPQLLVRWLSELLYLYDGEGFVTTASAVTITGTTRLHAAIRGERFDPARHSATLDVKAVTYHRLAFDHTPEGWRARVFLDI